MPSSGYSLRQGEPFFILSDQSFSSTEKAAVRVELPSSSQYDDGGLDVQVYRVPNALEFLKKQKNLHRPRVAGQYAGEGLSNTLSYWWDNQTKRTRRSWQRILSNDVRTQGTTQIPATQYGEQMNQLPRFENPLQFKPLPGMELTGRFRYPVNKAAPVQPPKGVKLDGSSSEWLSPQGGNFMVPVGKLKPGLYLVEAALGGHRANTLLFVSDTVGIVKNAGQQMLVWTTSRQTGKPVANTTVMWTDGAGVLQSGKTGGDGVANLQKASPEHSFVLGQDAAGGVFVAESDYYDSEIYNAKLYAVTDRPLYRPGDEVKIKFMGRVFKNARTSTPLASGELRVQAFDPNGTQLWGQTVKLGANGADTRFRLPKDATPGGYDLRFSLGDDQYGAAFRVADYIKPHFDINLAFNKPSYKAGEAISGRIELRYPDGKPVKDADLTLNVRAQAATLVDGELQYAGLFPVQLEQQELKSDKNGNIALSLPPAKNPSRYVLTLLASDGAAYRVKVTRELLVERGVNPWKLTTARHFTQPGESAVFDYQPLGQGGGEPVQWEITRLESQAKTQGKLTSGSRSVPIQFSSPGSYTVSLRDANGNLLAATSHWVAGEGLVASAGSIEIVLDKDKYEVGETAEALITFPEAVSEALLTLERDQVESHALLSAGANWVAMEKLSARQWKARIKVRDEFAPNMTFSVLFAKGNDYVFQNAGLVVAQPQVAVALNTAKTSYAPGETVTLDLQTTLAGKPVPAQVALSVVDEMIYVLQPEIAPSVVDFFYHPRRNSVRTAASLSFISYDMARSYLPGAQTSRPRAERAVKVLERPRREEEDTALWAPSIQTDSAGKARITFRVPDSLTRWRMTARAMTTEGVVGQRTAYLLSEKALYVKWTGPQRFRADDKPTASLVVFNQTGANREAELRMAGATVQTLTLKPGANYLTQPITPGAGGPLNLQLVAGNAVVDQLTVNLRTEGMAWRSPRHFMFPMLARVPEYNLSLPADSRNIRLSLSGPGASQFSRVVDELIDYPYGCVEQTSSRLIPLAMAVQGLQGTPEADRLRDLLSAQRLRLVKLAGGDGVFGWWGNPADESAFLSAYAYFADFYAARSLGISLPADHAAPLLEIYKKNASKEPLFQRALTVWWLQTMGQPTDTLIKGLAESWSRQAPAKPVVIADTDSPVLAAPDSLQSQQMSTLLIGHLHGLRKLPMPANLAKGVKDAQLALQTNPNPFVQALLARSLNLKASPAILDSVSSTMPTLERAMTLVWWQQTNGGLPAAKPVVAKLGPGWQEMVTESGNREWRWVGAGVPNRVSFSQPPSDGGSVIVRYDSTATETTKLPADVWRTLYRLVPTGKEALQFRLVEVKPGTALRTDQLYLDEVGVATKGKQRMRYGLLEIPLPPGGEVENSSWGVTLVGLDGDKQPQPLEVKAYEGNALGYQVPIARLEGAEVSRQLLRFGSRGRFVLPAARFWRMYEPSLKAFEDVPATGRVLTVE